MTKNKENTIVDQVLKIYGVNISPLHFMVESKGGFEFDKK